MKKTLFLFGFLFRILNVLSSAHAATNKELRIGISQEFESIHPVTQHTTAAALISQLGNHYLMTLDADWKWVCQLCVELPTLENGKAKLIDVAGKKKIVAQWEIKASAKWADGTPVTGKDVKLGWEVGSSPNVSVGEKQMYTQIESVVVDAQNPQKFTITYAEAGYDFNHLHLLALLPDHLERAIWEKTKATTGEYEKQTLYSTHITTPGLYNGPYKIVEAVPGSHVILEPNPHFYGGTPKIAKIIYKIIPDTATLEANLISGTIDMVSELGFRLDQALAFEKKLAADSELSKRFKIVYRDGVTYEHIDLNLRNPLLQDVRVRQALLFAVDREKVTQSLFNGKQKKALSFFNPSDPYYTTDVIDYSYDLPKANALLDAAGWKLAADGYRYKDGKKLSFELMTTAGDKTRELIEVYLQNEWKKAGIEIVIKNQPARVYFGETVAKVKYSAMAMYAFISTPDTSPHPMLHSSQIPTEKNGYSGQNRPGWVNAAADKAMDAVKLEFDPVKRKELMKTVVNEYMRELPALPLYYRVDIAVLPINLTGFQITGHQLYSTNAVMNWNLE